MNKLWTCEDWSQYVKYNARTGLRLRFDKDADAEVKRACKEFAKWLRYEYEFPIRVPVYLKATPYIKTIYGNASAIFFGPFDKTLEPYIRVSVGDYYDLLRERGKNNALACILGSIAHELTHYYQWIKGSDLIEVKSEKQAKYYVDRIIGDYACTRDSP